MGDDDASWAAWGAGAQDEETSAPIAGLAGGTVDRNGQVVFFGQDTAGSLHVVAGDGQGGWTDTDLAEAIHSVPEATRLVDGRMMVAYTSPALDVRCVVELEDGTGWQPAFSLGGSVLGSPHVVQAGDGSVNVHVIGSDHSWWSSSAPAGDPTSFGDFQPMGGGNITYLAGARGGDGLQMVFHMNTSGQIWGREQIDDQGTWGDFYLAFEGADTNCAFAVAIDSQAQPNIATRTNRQATINQRDASGAWTPTILNASTGEWTYPPQFTRHLSGRLILTFTDFIPDQGTFPAAVLQGSNPYQGDNTWHPDAPAIVLGLGAGITQPWSAHIALPDGQDRLYLAYPNTSTGYLAIIAMPPA
ncbi:hypothetical protein ACIOUE_35875 [Streptomyces xanthochromogenes]|uniref:hypothetical protein n=1 Tax=Streptomyces xanthochromogenes TaxID=67384 RepID=UPI003827179B